MSQRLHAVRGVPNVWRRKVVDESSGSEDVLKPANRQGLQFSEGRAALPSRSSIASALHMAHQRDWCSVSSPQFERGKEWTDTMHPHRAIPARAVPWIMCMTPCSSDAKPTRMPNSSCRRVKTVEYDSRDGADWRQFSTASARAT